MLLCYLKTNRHLRVYNEWEVLCCVEYWSCKPAFSFNRQVLDIRKMAFVFGRILVIYKTDKGGKRGQNMKGQKWVLMRWFFCISFSQFTRRYFLFLFLLNVRFIPSLISCSFRPAIWTWPSILVVLSPLWINGLTKNCSWKNPQLEIR